LELAICEAAIDEVGYMRNNDDIDQEFRIFVLQRIRSRAVRVTPSGHGTLNHYLKSLARVSRLRVTWTGARWQPLNMITTPAPEPFIPDPLIMRDPIIAALVHSYQWEMKQHSAQKRTTEITGASKATVSRRLRWLLDEARTAGGDALVW